MLEMNISYVNQDELKIIYDSLIQQTDYDFNQFLKFRLVNKSIYNRLINDKTLYTVEARNVDQCLTVLKICKNIKFNIHHCKLIDKEMKTLIFLNSNRFFVYGARMG